MQLSRRDFMAYSVGAAGSLLLPTPLLAARARPTTCPAITEPNPERRRYSEKELRHLNVTLHPYLTRSKKKRHVKHMKMIEEGLKKHGLSPTYEAANKPVDSDVAIGWSGRHSKLRKHRLKHGLNTLLMEYGFFQPRKKWPSLAWEGINGCGQFVVPDDGGERWNTLFAHHLKPWQEHQDGYILLMGQTPGDRAIYGLKMNGWLDKIAIALAAHDKEIVFRPHPRKRKQYARKENPKPLPSNTRLSSHKNLHKDLAGAAFAVTYSSTAAVEAVLAGVPCVTIHEGSIARPVTSQDIMDPYHYPDRTQWCHETAWKQWSRKELKNGDAWDVVRQYLLA